MGYLKIITLYDFKLLMINNNEELCSIELTHPFLRFVLFLHFEEVEKAAEIANSFNKES